MVAERLEAPEAAEAMGEEAEVPPAPTKDRTSPLRGSRVLLRCGMTWGTRCLYHGESHRCLDPEVAKELGSEACLPR